MRSQLMERRLVAEIEDGDSLGSWRNSIVIVDADVASFDVDGYDWLEIDVLRFGQIVFL